MNSPQLIVPDIGAVWDTNPITGETADDTEITSVLRIALEHFTAALCILSAHSGYARFYYSPDG